MSLSETYLLASKVRNKLTKDASNPKISLRNLVTQANMLDNLMDVIQVENTKRLNKLSNVKFDLSKQSHQSRQPSNLSINTSIIEYEVDGDSDEEESDSDSDYYYSSEEEDEDDVEIQEEELISNGDLKLSDTALNENFKLTTISEEEENIPDLTISSDEESDEEIINSANYNYNTHNNHYNNKDKYHNSYLLNKLHQRNEVYSLNEVY